MIEDLTGNIKRVVDGLAKEIAARAAADLGGLDPSTLQVRGVIERHARQVLIDWFLGEFIPHDKR